MPNELRVFNPLQVVGSWTTPTGVLDLSDGVVLDQDFFSTAPAGNEWEIEADGNGNTTAVYKPGNRHGTFSLAVSASSALNLQLSGRVIASRTTLVKGLLLVRDLNGDTVINHANAFLQGIPGKGFGQARGMNLWVWNVGQVDAILGGHNVA
jgi:hypothetical protein